VAALSSPRIVVVDDVALAVVVVEEEHSVIGGFAARANGYPEVATAQHSLHGAGIVAKEVLADASDAALADEPDDDVSIHVDADVAAVVAAEVLALAVECETCGSHGEADTLLFLLLQTGSMLHVPSMVAMEVPHHRVALGPLVELEADHTVLLVVHVACCSMERSCDAK
jgi:hypothetical protein